MKLKEYKKRQIPEGHTCYTILGPFENGRLPIKTCPHWERTDHGTIRCNYLKLESIEADVEGSYEKALEFFGSEEKVSKKAPLDLLFDQIKCCGVKEFGPLY